MLLLVLLWQGAARLAADPALFPGPAAVLFAFWSALGQGSLAGDLAITLARVAASFALAFLPGALIGIAMGRRRALDRLALPWILIALNLPALVLIVLAYLWIGLNETAAIVAVAASKLPNVAITLREGARALDPALDELASVYRLSPWRKLGRVLLPQLAPDLLGAARNGLALVWKIVLVVELLGRPNGVGFAIGTRFQLFDVAGILAYALAFLLVVLLVEWVLLRPLERRLRAWREPS